MSPGPGAIMRLAILSDIHANRDAFAAVLNEPAVQAADRIVMLGDLVGYGPDPGWCLRRAADLVDGGAVCLMGNNDLALLQPGLKAPAQATLDWTRAALAPAELAFLAARPMTAMIGEVFLSHGGSSMPHPSDYVTDVRSAQPVFRATAARVTICGHLHVPHLFHRDGLGRVEALALPASGLQPVPPPDRWLAVAGAVGQPRDGDARACWLLVDLARDEIAFCRVAYDTAATAARIRAAGLPESLAARLLIGC